MAAAAVGETEVEKTKRAKGEERRKSKVPMRRDFNRKTSPLTSSFRPKEVEQAPDVSEQDADSAMVLSR